jgi:hypothetical protein
MGIGGILSSTHFAGGFGSGKLLHQGSHPGEVIPNRNFTYHSIGELETLIPHH